MWVNLNGSVEIQRSFIVQELTRGFAAGADNLFWFAVREVPVEEGKVLRWLISIDHQPINGYSTFQHLANRIGDAFCVGRYHNVPADIEAYKFIAPGRSLYILWSSTITQTVMIPAMTSAVLSDRDGETSRVVTAQGGQVSFEVGAEPVFLEISY
jgi:hypothetical protein